MLSAMNKPRRLTAGEKAEIAADVLRKFREEHPDRPEPAVVVKSSTDPHGKPVWWLEDRDA